MSISSHDQLLHLYQELRHTIDPTKLDQVSEKDHAAAEEIAKNILLKAETKGEKVKIHFSAKRWYDKAWGAIRQLLPFVGKAKAYDFSRNYQVIAHYFKGLDQTLMSPEIEKLGLILNAMAKNIAKADSTLPALEKIALPVYSKEGRGSLTAKSIKKRPLPPIPQDVAPYRGPQKQQSNRQNSASNPPNKTTLPPPPPPRFDPIDTQAPVAPPRSCQATQHPCLKERIDRLVGEKNKDDPTFLDSFMDELSQRKTMKWSRLENSQLVAMFHPAVDTKNKTDFIDAPFIAKTLSEMLNRATEPSEQELDILDLIFEAITQHDDYENLKQTVNSQKEALRSSDYQQLIALVSKSENQRSPEERCVFSNRVLRAELTKVKNNSKLSLAEIIALSKMVKEIIELQPKLKSAKDTVAQINQDTSFLLAFAHLKPPTLANQVIKASDNSLEEIQKTLTTIREEIGAVDALKKAKDSYDLLQNELTKLQEQAQELQSSDFFSAFFQKILPFSQPLLREVAARTLLTSANRAENIPKRLFQSLEEYSEWANTQKKILSQYQTAITALEQLKNVVTDTLNQSQRDTLVKIGLTKGTFIKSLLGSVEEWEHLATALIKEHKWPTVKSDDYNAFQKNLQADLAFAEGKSAAGTNKGYWGPLFRAEENLQELAFAPKYYLDSYVSALTTTAGSVQQAITEYKNLWQTMQTFRQTGNGKTQDKEHFCSFCKRANECRTAMAHEHTALAQHVGSTSQRSNLTRKLLELDEKWQKFLTLSPVAGKEEEFQMLLARSSLGEPPRLSSLSESYIAKQKALLSQVEKTAINESKTESILDAMKKMKLPSMDSTPLAVDENEDEWK